MTCHLKVLLVEDNPGDAFLIRRNLADAPDANVELACVDRLSKAVEYLEKTGADIALLDLGLPDSSGLETLYRFRESAPWIPVVVLTGNDEDGGVKALKAGAQDYLVKGQFSDDLLVRVLRYATERHQTQEVLRESEKFLRSALDALSAHVAIVDDNGGIVAVNLAWRRLAETGKCALCNVCEGEDYLDSCERAEGGAISAGRDFGAGIRSVISEETDFFEMEYAWNDSTDMRWFQSRITPFCGGGPGKVVISHEDITARKRATEELRNSELRLRTILDAQTSKIVHVDTDLKVLWPNLAACEAARLPEGEIIGRPCHEIWQSRMEKCETCPVLEAIAKGDPQVFQLKSPDGRTWRVLGCPVRDENGRIVSAVEIAEDITRQLAMEDQLRQAQKMEAIGALAGGIAHDFNNILTSILGFTRLAMDETRKDSTIMDNLQEVYAAGKRAKEVVKQILTFARKSDEKLHPIQIKQVVKESMKFMRNFIPASVEINSNIESNSVIMGNPTQIHQIVMNLCTNAVQAMEDGVGVLEVDLADVSVADEPDGKLLGLRPGKYVELKIADNGIGIAPDKISSIFEPYFTTKEFGEGTGMGLAVVHGIVEGCGGKVKVKSSQGKGTTFSVYLPAETRRELAAANASQSFSVSGGERILFVDDEPMIVRMARQLLESMHYSVTTRTSSVAALELFRSRPDDFDLVVTDMTMPNMTGEKLAAEIMKIRPDTPVILCTGYHKKITDRTAPDFGVKALVNKPFEKADLATKVRKVLDDAKRAHVRGQRSIDLGARSETNQ